MVENIDDNELIDVDSLTIDEEDSSKKKVESPAGLASSAGTLDLAVPRNAEADAVAQEEERKKRLAPLDYNFTATRDQTQGKKIYSTPISTTIKDVDIKAIDKALKNLPVDVVNKAGFVDKFSASYAKQRNVKPSDVKHYATYSANANTLIKANEALEKGDTQKAATLYMSQMGNFESQALFGLSKVAELEGDPEAAKQLEEESRFVALPKVGSGTTPKDAYGQTLEEDILPYDPNSSNDFRMNAQGEFESTGNLESRQAMEGLENFMLPLVGTSVHMVSSGIDKSIKGLAEMGDKILGWTDKAGDALLGMESSDMTSAAKDANKKMGSTYDADASIFNGALNTAVGLMEVGIGAALSGGGMPLKGVAGEAAVLSRNLIEGVSIGEKIASSTAPLTGYGMLAAFEGGSRLLPPEVSAWLMPISKLVDDYYGGKAPDWAKNMGFILELGLLGKIHHTAGEIESAINKYGGVVPAAKEGYKSFDKLIKELEPKYNKGQNNLTEQKLKEYQAAVEQIKSISSLVAEGMVDGNYEAPKPATTTADVTNGMQADINGQRTQLRVNDEGSIYIIDANGNPQIIKPWNMPDKPLADFGIQALQETSPAQVAQMAGDGAVVKTFEYEGRQYLISIGKNGEYVFENTGDGQFVNRLDVQGNRKFADARKEEILNAFKQSQPIELVEAAEPAKPLEVSMNTREIIEGKIADTVSPTEKASLEEALRVVTSMESAHPGTKVILHSSAESINKAAGERGTKLAADETVHGFFFGKELHLNQESIQSNTLVHEAVEMLLAETVKKNPEKIDALYEQLKGVDSSNSAMKYGEQYEGDAMKKKEAIVEYISRVANGEIEVKDSNYQMIKDFVKKFLNMVGFDFKITDRTELLDLAKEIRDGFDKGKVEQVKAQKPVVAEKGVNENKKEAIKEKPLEQTAITVDALKNTSKETIDELARKERLANIPDSREVVDKHYPKNIHKSIEETNLSKEQKEVLSSLNIEPLNFDEVKTVSRGDSRSDIGDLSTYEQDVMDNILDSDASNIPLGEYHKNKGGAGLGVGMYGNKGNWASNGIFVGVGERAGKAYPLLSEADITQYGKKAYTHQFELREGAVIISKADAQKITPYEFKNKEHFKEVTEELKSMGIDGVWDRGELLIIDPVKNLKKGRSFEEGRQIGAVNYGTQESLVESYNRVQKIPEAKRTVAQKEFVEAAAKNISPTAKVTPTTETVQLQKTQTEKKSSTTKLFSEPLEEAKTIADRYAKGKGFERETFELITRANFDKAKAIEIAKAYEKMKDDPSNPEVKAAYEKMVEETGEQFAEILKDGYEIEVNNSEPYSSSEEMIADLRNNKKMKIFSTESGFGDTPITDAQRASNPLLRYSGIKDKNGVRLLWNDIFRFVHDFFGHSELGNSFGEVGEENAWLNHATMYTPLARRAMTSETRGQNSWVNSSGVNEKAFQLRDKARKLRQEGKIEEADKLVQQVYEQMKFADQKIGLLPEKYSNIDQAKAPLSELRGKVGDIKYPDVVFGGSKTKAQAETAVSFYENIVGKFNEVFGRDLKLEGKAKNDGNFDVTVEYETGLKPKYFSYPSGKIGEHKIVDNINKDVPMTSLRHELIHEMLVKNITDKFERINEMDNSANLETIDEVQRNRAYNYTPEDVFYERVVEAIERAPDNVDTFDISSYGTDITNRLKQEISGKPTKENVSAALGELLDGSNAWLTNNLNFIFKNIDYSKINDITEVADIVGKQIKDKFENSRTIFPAELYNKIEEFTKFFNEQYEEKSKAVTSEVGSVGGKGDVVLFRGSNNAKDNGNYFTPNKSYAESFGKTKVATLSKDAKVFDVNNEVDFNKLLSKVGEIYFDGDGSKFKSFDDFLNHSNGDIIAEANNSWIAEKYSNEVKNMGYDAVKFQDGGNESYLITNKDKILTEQSLKEAPQLQKTNLVEKTYYENNLTESKDGKNYVFYHTSGADPKSIAKGIDSSKFNSTRTSRNEKGLQYGVASYYTKGGDGERMVSGERYAVSVPKEKVYPMDTDPNGYKAKAEKIVPEGTPFRFEKVRKEMADLAKNDGYEMAVGEWNYSRKGAPAEEGRPEFRADALVPLKPSNQEGAISIAEKGGKRIPHPQQKFYQNEESLMSLADDIQSYYSGKKRFEDPRYEIANTVRMSLDASPEITKDQFDRMTANLPAALRAKAQKFDFKSYEKELKAQKKQGIETESFPQLHKTKAATREITMPDGSKKTVKDVGAEVVNGFYSPLEKTINETKLEKMPAKQWADKFGKGEEAEYTGLKQWLSKQPGSISKAEIQEYLKNNRISIEEVVKGESVNDKAASEIENKLQADGYKIELSENEDINIYHNGMLVGEAELPKDVNFLVTKWSDLKLNSNSQTKFSQWQLEGDKSNYKEVLVTMPNKKGKSTDAGKKMVAFRSEMDAKYGEGARGKMSENETKKLKDLIELAREEGTFDEKTKFKSSHFEEPNILVHLRMNTRKAADGSKVLFLEEVQSDWGQKGREEGFTEPTPQSDIDAVSKYNVLINKQKALEEKAVDYILNNRHEEIKNEFDNLNKQIAEVKGGLPDYAVIKDGFANIDVKPSVPAAPFVTDTNAWTKLGLKMALKEAVKQDADKIAWTTGEQQNTRYDLSKQADEISYLETKEKGIYDVKATKDKKEIFADNKMDLKKIEATLGKDMAEKISNGVGEVKRGITFISGNDLKVGGKGMKGFYGSPTEGSLGIVGNVAKSLFKQEPSTVKIQGGEKLSNPKIIKDIDSNGDNAFFVVDNNGFKSKPFYNRGGAEQLIEDSVLHTQQSIEVTPELKEYVEDGMPQFHKSKKYGIKNEATEAENEYLGFTPRTPLIESQKRDVQMIQEGADRFKQSGGNVEALVNETIRKRNQLNAEQLFAVLDHKIDMAKKMSDAEDRVIQGYKLLETDNISKEEQNQNIATLKDYTKKFNAAQDALQVSGYEQGLAFRMRQIMKNEDYSFAETERKYLVASKGKPMSEDVREQLKTQAKEIEETRANLEKLQGIIAKLESETAVKDIADDVKKTKPSTKTPFQQAIERMQGKSTKKVPVVADKMQALADQVRKARIVPPGMTRGSATLIDVAWDGAVEVVARTIETSKDIIIAAQAAVDYIKTKFPEQYAKEGSPEFDKMVSDHIISYLNDLAPSIKIDKSTLQDIVDAGVESEADMIAKVREAIKEENPNATDAQIMEAVIAAANEGVKGKKSQARMSEDNELIIPKQIIRDVVSDALENGETLTADQLTERVMEAIAEDVPDATHVEVKTAITEYGKQVNPPEGDLAVEIARLKRNGKLELGLSDAKLGKGVKKSGFSRPKDNDEQRAISREIDAVLSKYPKDAAELEGMWVTALGKAKTRLTNAIADNQKRIDDIKNGIVTEKEKRAPLVLDEEAKLLEERNEELKKELRQLEGKPELSVEQKINNAIRTQESAIKKLESDIDDLKKGGAIDNAPDKTPLPTNEKIEDLKEKRATLIKEKQQLLNDAKDELNQLNEMNGVTEEARVEKYINMKQKQLDKILKQNESGVRDAAAPKKEAPSSPEIDAINQEISDAMEEYDSIFDIEKERTAAQLERRKKLLEKMVDFNVKRLDALLQGKPDPKAIKPPPQSNADIDQLSRHNKYLLDKIAEVKPKSGMTDAQRINMLISAAERRKTEFERRAEEIRVTGDYTVPGKKARPQSPELAAAEAAAERAKEAYNLAMEANDIPRIRATQQTLKANQKTLNDLRLKLRNKDLSYKAINRLTDYNNPALVAVKEALKAERETLRQLREEAGIIEYRRVEMYKKRIAEQIKELEKQKAAGQFKPRSTPKAEIEMTDAMKVEANKLTQLKFDRDVALMKAEYDAKPLGIKIMQGIMNGVNLPKSMMASLDLSAPLRQGAILSAAHPGIAWEATKFMLGSVKSEKVYNDWMNDLKNEPIYYDIKKHKLFLAENTVNMNAAEEAFISNWSEGLKKIPVYGRLVKGSETAYSAYLNMLRVRVFEQFKNTLTNSGVTGKEFEESLTHYANFINNASGRGNLGPAESSRAVMNMFLFSPGFIASRFNLLLGTATGFNRVKNGGIDVAPWAMKKRAYKDMASYIGVGLSTMALMKAAGMQVDDDPKSASFGKIRNGDVTYDIWAGFQQEVVLFSRVIAKASTSMMTGKTTDWTEKGNERNFEHTVMDFLRYKASPAAGLSLDAYLGRNAMGEPITLGGQIAKTTLPMWAADFAKLIQADRTGEIPQVLIPSLLGVGVQILTPREKAVVVESNLTPEAKEAARLSGYTFQQKAPSHITIYKNRNPRDGKDISLSNEQKDALNKKINAVAGDIINKAVKADYNDRMLGRVPKLAGRDPIEIKAYISSIYKVAKIKVMDEKYGAGNWVEAKNPDPIINNLK